MSDNELQELLIRMMEAPEETGNDTAERFKKLMTMYHCAIREVRTKFEVLNEELSVGQERNPIQSVASRVKSPKSIYEKLSRKHCPFELEAMRENLDDIAGIRVVCQFIDDIYTVAEMLGKQDDVTVVQVKDYIANPKPNGYRSYHMIVEIPVFFSDAKRMVRVEIQLRTIAMDFWASLEHNLKYKKDVVAAEEIAAELKLCAEDIAVLDQKMQVLKEKMHRA